MSFLGTARVLLVFSGLAAVTSIVLLFTPGLKLSIEFSGGSLIELALPEATTKEQLTSALETFRLTDGSTLVNPSVTATQDGSVLIRLKTMTNEEHLALLSHLTTALGEIKELQFTTIGPTVGATMKSRALLALLAASVGIILYLAFAFRNVPRRFSPWKFGVLAVLALLHDLLITTGIFVILSLFTTFEFDTLFVTALLTVLGYSTNDTIVIFDRIRENVSLANRNEDFEQVVERSLQESVVRTMGTGQTALYMLFAMVFFGPVSIRWFMLALIIGTIIGTYSSFFIATPLLVYWRKRE
ncbi:MAG: protein translocase subunit SecF [Candidatus Peregrinibacteria bacterium]